MSAHPTLIAEDYIYSFQDILETMIESIDYSVTIKVPPGRPDFIKAFKSRFGVYKARHKRKYADLISPNMRLAYEIEDSGEELTISLIIPGLFTAEAGE